MTYKIVVLLTEAKTFSYETEQYSETKEFILFVDKLGNSYKYNKDRVVYIQEIKK